jgi:hypothetical protein
MAKYAHPDVLDQGPNFIKVNCNSLAVVSAYTFGDSYATVSAAILATVAMVTGDFVLSTAVNDRILTTAAGKSDPSAAAGGTSSHLAFLDTVNSKVLWVTEETSVQTIAIANVVNFPSLVYTTKQPITA